MVKQLLSPFLLTYTWLFCEIFVFHLPHIGSDLSQTHSIIARQTALVYITTTPRLTSCLLFKMCRSLISQLHEWHRTLALIICKINWIKFVLFPAGVQQCFSHVVAKLSRDTFWGMELWNGIVASVIRLSHSSGDAG